MKILLSLVFLLPTIVFSQKFDEEQQAEQYAYNIQQEFINEIYIPSDVGDALKQLDLLSDEAGRNRLLEADEQLAAERLVFGLGKWMIVNWNFYEGSRLSHHLREYGVTHPDDMAKFLIVSYHRHLRGIPLELESRGAQFYEKRKLEQEARNARKKVVGGSNEKK